MVGDEGHAKGVESRDWAEGEGTLVRVEEEVGEEGEEDVGEDGGNRSMFLGSSSSQSFTRGRNTDEDGTAVV
ncbi:hypothetical protein L1987_46851 [Smallanthus sonchifolius]|uniref:Uncharacterized protein n=1 Tax=Smallanthus sonchifolius TaxID=185202 RepID=A0ACB9G2P1_9ASTR|nr:hypothetical protein L1987_46851 [Smallanthus sonchifolius]